MSNQRVSGYASGSMIALTILDCADCGVVFAITQDYEQRRRSDARGFRCPNGHTLSYKTSDTERLEKSRARETHLKDQLRAATEDAEKTRVALLRDRHRFANGVCPCCNRYFDNVRRHMAGQHPDYDVAQIHQAGETRYGCTCGSSFTTPRGLAIHQGRMRSDDWATQADSWHRGHLTEVSR